MQHRFEKSILTFATNQMSYVRFAINCAESILLQNDIPVFIVSNLVFPIPEKHKGRIFIITPKPEHLSLGIGMKLYIDEYLQTESTLFIDSDCICYGDLNEIFSACDGMDVTVAGNIVPSEVWCGDVQANAIDEHFGIDKLIRYNGGLYYIKRSSLAKKIFDKAREIAEKYDDYGFQRIKNKWINEEGPISIAMVLNKQLPISDDGRFMTDMYTDPRPSELNVLRGARLLRNQLEGERRYRPWYPALYSPLIIHFGGSNLYSYPYNSQTTLLKLNNLKLPTWLSTLLVNIFIDIPYKTYYWLSK